MSPRETYRSKKTSFPIIASMTILAALMTGAGPMDALTSSHVDAHHAVHDAEHAVDYAWETYHRAALGGTIASPEIQQTVEEHLHESRGLVLKAREAAEGGDRRLVDTYLKEITKHLEKAIKGSTELKK